MGEIQRSLREKQENWKRGQEILRREREGEGDHLGAAE